LDYFEKSGKIFNFEGGIFEFFSASFKKSDQNRPNFQIWGGFCPKIDQNVQILGFFSNFFLNFGNFLRQNSLTETFPIEIFEFFEIFVRNFDYFEKSGKIFNFEGGFGPKIGQKCSKIGQNVQNLSASFKKSDQNLQNFQIWGGIWSKN